MQRRPNRPDAPVVHGERLLDALGRRRDILQGRRDRKRERILLTRVHGHGFEPPRLPLRPLSAPRLDPPVLAAFHPRPGGGRRVHPTAPRPPGPSRPPPPAPPAPAELLRPSRPAVCAPIRPASASTIRPANRTADRESADPPSNNSACATGCPGHGGTAHGRQEALPELRDDGQRRQHVLLLLREPVPLSRNTVGLVVPVIGLRTPK